jgi:Kinase binding protein CGI-121
LLTQIAQHVRDRVKGTELPFEDSTLASLANMTKVRKHYKLGVQNATEETFRDRSDWENPTEVTKVILGSIALRGST